MIRVADAGCDANLSPGMVSRPPGMSQNERQVEGSHAEHDLIE